MKYRSSFVTNSSSSSFIISKRCLDDDQIEAIKWHSILGEKLGLDCCDEPWAINENENYITGHTWMDNFDMYEFLEMIDVKDKNVNWSEYPFDLPEDDETQDINKETDWRRLLYEN